MANASERSKVILIDSKAKTEEFKRPDHPDFMDSSELKAIEFTGVRLNKLAAQYEFWIVGKVVRTVTEQELRRNPDALNLAHQEVFRM